MPFMEEDEQWRRRLSAYVQAGGEHFEHHFQSRIVHMQTC